MIAASERIVSLIYGLELETVAKVHDEDFEYLSDLNGLYARLLEYVPKSNDNLPIFSTRKKAPNKHQRVNHQLQHIPYKPATKAQQKNKRSFEHKRKRLRLNKKSTANVPYNVYEQNERKREEELKQHTQKVIEERQEQIERVPKYYTHDINIDMNDTISHNNDNHNNDSGP